MGISIGPVGIDAKARIPTNEVDWGVVARYNGSWCPYLGERAQRIKTCGV